MTTDQAEQITCPKCGGPAKEITRRMGRLAMKTCNCPACEEKRAADTKELERQRDALKLVRLKEYAGLTGAMTECTFDNYHTMQTGQLAAYENALGFCVDIQANKNSWLALVGKTGTGKTHLALAVANKLIEDGLYTVRYWKLIRLMRRIRATYNRDNPETEQQVIGELDNCCLLILDEFGIREAMSDWERATLDDLIDHRWEQRLPLIITSNLSANEVMALAGERIESRFAQFGQVVRFTWEDYRMGKGVRNG